MPSTCQGEEDMVASRPKRPCDFSKAAKLKGALGGFAGPS